MDEVKKFKSEDFGNFVPENMIGMVDNEVFMKVI